MKIDKKEILSKVIIILFLMCILVRDIFEIKIPLIVLTLIWCTGLIIWREEKKFVFTVSAIICFASSISITLPILFFLFKIGRAHV